MRNEQLVTMINEIAGFFRAAGDEAQGAENVANHVRRYWDPRMRRQITQYAEQGGEELVPLARAAVHLLSR